MSRIFNADLELLPSLARTATTNSSQIENEETYRGIRALINVTNVTTSGVVTVSVQGYDEVLAGYFTYITSAALTASGITIVKVHPELIAVTNAVAQDFLTDKWRVAVTHTGFDGGNPASVTYAVTAHMLK